jgi:hypothetical protein
MKPSVLATVPYMSIGLIRETTITLAMLN